jgi:hypothetical protein
MSTYRVDQLTRLRKRLAHVVSISTDNADILTCRILFRQPSHIHHHLLLQHTHHISHWRIEANGSGLQLLLVVRLPAEASSDGVSADVLLDEALSSVEGGGRATLRTTTGSAGSSSNSLPCCNSCCCGCCGCCGCFSSCSAILLKSSATDGASLVSSYLSVISCTFSQRAAVELDEHLCVYNIILQSIPSITVRIALCTERPLNSCLTTGNAE